jgi:hypothetical protein
MLGGGGPLGGGGLAGEPADDGPRDWSLRTYANINRINKPAGSSPGSPGRTPADFAEYALAAKNDGWDAIKLGPFDGGARDISGVGSADAQAGIACLAAVRAAVGPETDVLVDVHGNFDAEGALALRDALAPLGLYWMEDACPGPESVTGPDVPAIENDEELAKAAASDRLQTLQGFETWCSVAADGNAGADGGPRVAGGESLSNPAHALQILGREHTFTTLMADIVFVGGISELRRVRGSLTAGSSFCGAGSDCMRHLRLVSSRWPAEWSSHRTARGGPWRSLPPCMRAHRLLRRTAQSTRWRVSLPYPDVISHLQTSYLICRRHIPSADVISHLQTSYPICRRHIPFADVISHLQTSYPICRRHIPSADVLSH